MDSTVKVKTRVLPRRRVEVETPELSEGELVEVSVATIAAEQPAEPIAEWTKRFDEWLEMPREHYPQLHPDSYHRASYYEPDE